MPVYEYKCAACDATFEELVLAERDAKRVVCPKCGDKRVKRVPSVFAAHSAAAKPSARPPGGCGQCSADGSCPYAG